MIPDVQPVRPEEALGDPRRTIPFDYRFRFEVGREDVGTTIQKTVEVSVEAAFVAVSMGYGLIPAQAPTVFGIRSAEDLDTPARPNQVLAVLRRGLLASRPGAPGIAWMAGGGGGGPAALPMPLSPAADALLQGLQGRVDAVPDRRAPRAHLSAMSAAERAQAADALEEIPPRCLTFGDIIRALSRTLGEQSFADRGDIGPQTASALDAGIRIRPDVARKLLPDGGFKPLDPRQLGTLFEVMPRPADPVRFLYALHDQGTGRSFQSEPILSIAGLGEDMGRRPFRAFTPPIRFEPRTVIRLDVTPRSRFGGELHFVLHGFKVLGGAGTPTGRALRRRRHGTR